MKNILTIAINQYITILIGAMINKKLILIGAILGLAIALSVIAVPSISKPKNKQYTSTNTGIMFNIPDNFQVIETKEQPIMEADKAVSFTIINKSAPSQATGSKMTVYYFPENGETLDSFISKLTNGHEIQIENCVRGADRCRVLTNSSQVGFPLQVISKSAAGFSALQLKNAKGDIVGFDNAPQELLGLISTLSVDKSRTPSQ